MNQTELYGNLMSTGGHVAGMVMLILTGVIIALRWRRKSVLFGILALAWCVRAGFVLYSTYMKTPYVDDFESQAFIDSQSGFEYVLDGFQLRQLYTSFCSLVYLVVGRSPLFLEAINLLLSILTIELVYELAEVVFDDKIAIRAALIMALFPESIYFGTTVTREAIWIYPATLGSLWLARGVKHNRPELILAAVAPFLLSYMFHSGALGLLCVWLIAPGLMLIAKRKHGMGQVFISAAVGLAVLIMAVGVIRLGVLSSWGTKFNLRTLTTDDIALGLEGAARDRTAYLTDVTFFSTPQLLLQLPLRFIYFIAMPFPWVVSNTIDIGGCFDGLCYAAGLIGVFRKWRFFVQRPEALTLLLGCLVSWGIFCVGTSNYGTAIRHRGKLAPVACVLFVGAWGLSQSRDGYRRSEAIRTVARVNRRPVSPTPRKVPSGRTNDQ
jgi:hypothetical protein